MNKDELKERIELAKQVPGIAHLASFGLILYGNQKGPVCKLCGGLDAPIVDNQHLPGWCIGGEKHEMY